MNYGLYLSANGINCSQQRMSVLANNLANVNTTAFKPSQVVLGERAREPEQMSSMTDGRRLLEQLGGGTRIGYSAPILEQGSLEQTNRQTDLALLGKGFLQLESDRKGEQLLTRDGRLRFDANGVLRHAASELAVLDTRGNQIRLDGKEQMQFAGFSSEGHLLDKNDLNQPFARIALVDAQEEALQLNGQNLFTTTDKLENAQQVEVVGGSLEQSGANPVTGMVELIKLTREIEMNSRLIQYQDAMIGQAVTSLGRVV